MVSLAMIVTCCMHGAYWYLAYMTYTIVVMQYLDGITYTKCVVVFFFPFFLLFCNYIVAIMQA